MIQQINLPERNEDASRRCETSCWDDENPQLLPLADAWDWRGFHAFHAFPVGVRIPGMACRIPVYG